MKLNTLLALLIIAITLLATVNSRRKSSKNNSKTSPYSTKRAKVKYTIHNSFPYKKGIAEDIIAQAFIMFSKPHTAIVNHSCIQEIFFKLPFNSANKKLWHLLTESLLVNKIPLKFEWLVEYASKNKISTLGVLCSTALATNLNYGLKGKTTNKSNDLREFITKQLDNSTIKTGKRMSKFITSSASTYKKDPLSTKDLYAKLNGRAALINK